MSQGESNKTTRLLLEQPDGGSITRNPSHSPTSSYQEPQPKELTTGRQVSKKPRSTSGIRAGRRRPVFNRRKSLQVSMTKTTTGPSNEQQQQQQQVNQNQPKGQHHLRPPADPLDCVGSFELVFDPDYVPPIDDSPPPPTPIKTREDIELDKIKEALADIGSIDIPRIASKTATATTTAATTPNETDQTDPLLSQGLETVSHAPKEIHSLARNNPEPRAESKDPSRYSNGIPKPFSSAPVPGFPHLRRIPMPQQMEIILLDILNDDTPHGGPFPLPMRPWWAYERQWQPLPRQEYLSDWMLVSENWEDRQPSAAPLVRPGFRTRYVDKVAKARAEEEAAIAILNEAHISASDVQSGRAEEDGEQYCSALSQMVGSESEENRLIREEELQLERGDEQPDQQQQQQYLHHDQHQDKQAAWDGKAGSYMPDIESPLTQAGVGGSFHLVNPPSYRKYRKQGCTMI